MAIYLRAPPQPDVFCPPHVIGEKYLVHAFRCELQRRWERLVDATSWCPVLHLVAHVGLHVFRALTQARVALRRLQPKDLCKLCSDRHQHIAHPCIPPLPVSLAHIIAIDRRLTAAGRIHLDERRRVVKGVHRVGRSQALQFDSFGRRGRG
eukprot:2222110-Prymnesium_polylepis.2